MASVQQLPSLEAPLSPLSSRPKRSVVERSLCGCTYLEMFFNRASMDLRAHLEDENGFCSATTFARSAPLPFVISTEAKRSGEISVWMHLLGNVFRQSIDGPAGPPKKTTMASIQQTTFARSAPLPFVISTEAKRSGEISVWMHLLGNVFRQSIDGPAGPPKKTTMASIQQTTFARSAPLPFVISTEAKRSGEISVW